MSVHMTYGTAEGQVVFHLVLPDATAAGNTVLRLHQMMSFLTHQRELILIINEKTIVMLRR